MNTFIDLMELASQTFIYDCFIVGCLSKFSNHILIFIILREKNVPNFCMVSVSLILGTKCFGLIFLIEPELGNFVLWINA